MVNKRQRQLDETKQKFPHAPICSTSPPRRPGDHRRERQGMGCASSKNEETAKDGAARVLQAAASEHLKKKNEIEAQQKAEQERALKEAEAAKLLQKAAAGYLAKQAMPALKVDEAKADANPVSQLIDTAREKIGGLLGGLFGADDATQVPADPATGTTSDAEVVAQPATPVLSLTIPASKAADENDILKSARFFMNKITGTAEAPAAAATSEAPVTAPATSEETAEPVAAEPATTKSSTAVPLIVTLTIEKEAPEKRLGLIMIGSTPRICSFHPGSLGEKEGMLIGDEILTINGEKPAGHDDAAEMILSSATLVIEIRRDRRADDPAATVPPEMEYTLVVDPEVKQSI